MSDIIKDEKQITPREQYAFDQFKKSDLPKLSPSLSAKLFELFLNGKTCEEIRKLNPQYTLGQIVAARIEGDWDGQRVEYERTLLAGVRRRAAQAQLETITLVADMLAAAKRVFGDKIARYFQTGDEAELGDLKIRNIKDLQALTEMLLKVTGQDTKKVQGEVHHHHHEEPEPPKRLTSDDADAILKMLEVQEDRKSGE